MAKSVTSNTDNLFGQSFFARLLTLCICAHRNTVALVEESQGPGCGLIRVKELELISLNTYDISLKIYAERNVCVHFPQQGEVLELQILFFSINGL